MDALRTAISPEGVATVTLQDAPGKNALSLAMVKELQEAFAELGHERSARCIVLAGLPEMFCSGASREVIEGLRSGKHDAGELLLPRVLLECPLPCIAAMEGHAIGGGFALGIAADIVMMAKESRYCMNFMDLGFTPGMGTTRLLEHVLSTAVAHELLFTGEARRGGDFAGCSGINHILPRAQLLPRALDLAQRIAEKPRPALVMLKRVLSLPRRQAFEGARTQETLMHTISFGISGVVGALQEAF